eukprot:gene57644-biopygen2221
MPVVHSAPAPRRRRQWPRRRQGVGWPLCGALLPFARPAAAWSAVTQVRFDPPHYPRYCDWLLPMDGALCGGAPCAGITRWVAATGGWPLYQVYGFKNGTVWPERSDLVRAPWSHLRAGGVQGGRKGAPPQCDPGYEPDPNVTLLCKEDGDVARFAAQVCAPAPTVGPGSPSRTPARVTIEPTSVTIAPRATPAFASTGRCVVDGGCITSSGYPGMYGSDENCDITPLRSGALAVEAFETEVGSYSHNDALTVADTRYAGSNGPNGVIVDTTTSISWSATVVRTKALRSMASATANVPERSMVIRMGRDGATQVLTERLTRRNGVGAITQQPLPILGC